MPAATVPQGMVASVPWVFHKPLPRSDGVTPSRDAPKRPPCALWGGTQLGEPASGQGQHRALLSHPPWQVGEVPGDTTCSSSSPNSRHGEPWLWLENRQVRLEGLGVTKAKKIGEIHCKKSEEKRSKSSRSITEGTQEQLGWLRGCV